MVAASFHLFISQSSAFRHKLCCENIFALSIVTTLTACLFSIKKCAKMSVFYVKAVKNSLTAGGYAPRPPYCLWRLEISPSDFSFCPTPLAKFWVRHWSRPTVGVLLSKYLPTTARFSKKVKILT